jgi:hypothetical protein
MRNSHETADLLTIDQASVFLNEPQSFILALHEMGLIAAVKRKQKQYFPQQSLVLTRNLLFLAQLNQWPLPTLAAFADLRFATKVTASLWTRPSPVIHSRQHWINLPDCRALFGTEHLASEGQDQLFLALLYCVALLSSHWPVPFRETGFAHLIDFIRNKYPQAWQEQAEAFPTYGPQILAGLTFTYSKIARPINSDLQTFIDNLSTATHASKKRPGASAAPGLSAFLKQIGVSTWVHVKFPLQQADRMIERILTLSAPLMPDQSSTLLRQLYTIAAAEVGWQNTSLEIQLKPHPQSFIKDQDQQLTVAKAIDTAHSIELVARYDFAQSTYAYRFHALVCNRFIMDDPSQILDIQTKQPTIRLPSAATVTFDYYDAVRKFPLLLWSVVTVQFVSEPPLIGHDSSPS